MSAVKASSALDPVDFLARCETLARQRGFRVESYGEVAPPARFAGVPALPLLALTRRRAGPRPRIYVSAGIHGDEPAGSEALLQLMNEGVFDDRATWLLAPLLNPAAFLLGTRENAESIDLNRDYLAPKSDEVAAHVRWLQRQPPFDLALCLHEDWEATGFYLYELNPHERDSLADAFLEGARRHLEIDPATVIDGRPVTLPGILRPDLDPRTRDLWAEAIYLRVHHTSLCYTLETPSGFPLAPRVSAHVAAVRRALEVFFASREATRGAQ